jgi:flagellar biosynthesis protein FliR
MPQLDTTTFISQIFFTFFIFMFLYINVIKWIIPYIHSFLTTKLKKTFFNSIYLNNLIITSNFLDKFKYIKIKKNLFLNWFNFESLFTKLEFNK